MPDLLCLDYYFLIIMFSYLLILGIDDKAFQFWLATPTALCAYSWQPENIKKY
jgi:hypothetical protein